MTTTTTAAATTTTRPFGCIAHLLLVEKARAVRVELLEERSQAFGCCVADFAAAAEVASLLLVRRRFGRL